MMYEDIDVQCMEEDTGYEGVDDGSVHGELCPL